MSMSNSESRKRAQQKAAEAAAEEQPTEACDGSTCDCTCGKEHHPMVSIEMPAGAALELAQILRKFDQVIHNDEVLDFHYERGFWTFLAEGLLTQLAEAGGIPEAVNVRPLEVVKP